MNNRDEKYTKYALCREMLETSDIFGKFKADSIKDYVKNAHKWKRILLTGEGSSRIFPAKRTLYQLNRTGWEGHVFTEGSTQAGEYNLEGCAVFGASNSGRTKELLRLLLKLKESGHKEMFGLTANSGTPLQDTVSKTHVLTCGSERAVAASKSVVEQALFYQSLAAFLTGTDMTDLNKAGNQLHQVLTLDIDPEIISAAAAAQTIYFAGRNDGVAEELTLKTNEITRKRSAFFEGTYALHGIEEILTEKDILIVIDPFKEEEEKFIQRLVQGVGMKVAAIASRPTMFPTIIIPQGGGYSHYLQLAAGWNFLVEVGLLLGIDLDHPVRARKVGNE